jgi:hypothetical protein
MVASAQEMRLRVWAKPSLSFLLFDRVRPAVQASSPDADNAIKQRLRYYLCAFLIKLFSLRSAVFKHCFLVLTFRILLCTSTIS